jgi:hypothetical protein
LTSGAETADSATIPEFTVVVVSLRYTFLCFVCVVFNASLFFSNLAIVVSALGFTASCYRFGILKFVMTFLMVGIYPSLG